VSTSSFTYEQQRTRMSLFCPMLLLVKFSLFNSGEPFNPAHDARFHPAAKTFCQ